MKKRAMVILSMTALSVMGTSVDASAITLPDSGSCNSNSECLYISNSGSGHAITGDGTIGVFGQSESSSGSGVYGIAAQDRSNGVAGQANGTLSNGVYGTSSGIGSAGIRGDAFFPAQNGVYGTTNNTGASGVFGFNSSGNGFGVAGRASGSGLAVYGDNTDSSGWSGYFTGRFYVAGQPYCNGAMCGWMSISDVRLKKNIKPLEGALDRLLMLRGVTFEWKAPEEHANQTGPQRGFIAQEVEKVLPEWVTTDEHGLKAIGTRGFEPMVVESLRTLRAENDALRDRVKALESRERRSLAGLGEGSGLLGVAASAMMAGALIVSRRRQSRV